MAKEKAGKAKSVFFCSECGNESLKWLGKCSACGAWNSYVEEIKAKPKTSGSSSRSLSEASTKPESLKDISLTNEIRITTGLSELDRVLGGGIIEGSVILIGGDPGIGKCRTRFLRRLLVRATRRTRGFHRGCFARFLLR